MGYSGHIVVIRSLRPSGEFTALNGVEVLHERGYRDGWRWVQLDGDLPGTLQTLVSETGAPALAAYIVDSDLADVHALTPRGVSWHTYLHQEMASSYAAPPLEQSADEVARQALAWADEAGLTADPDDVVNALAAKNVFAEESLEVLLGALGTTPEDVNDADGTP